MLKLFLRIVMTGMIAIALFSTMLSAADRPPAVAPQRQLVTQPPPEFLNKLKADTDALIGKYNAEIKQQMAAKNKNLANELKNIVPSKKPGIAGIDSTMPVISAIVPAAGIDSGQSFKVLGNNLTASGVPTVVTVQFASQTPPLTDQGANSSSQLNYIMGRFEGIAGPTPATVTVKVGNKVSAPFACTVFPEKVTQSMDLGKVQDHLISDSRSTSPLVDDPLGKGTHKFFIASNYFIQSLHNTWDLHLINKPAELTGTDEFFLTLKLVNNWKVKQIVFANYVNKNTNTPGCTAGAISTAALQTVIDPIKPTDSLYTKVSWWNQICSMYQAYFSFSYIIEGPKGMPYH